MTTLANQFFRCHCFSIQQIFNFHFHRQLLITSPLKIYIISITVPDQLSILLCKGLIPHYVLNITQTSFISQFLSMFNILDPLTDNCLPHITGCIRFHIYCFFLGSITFICKTIGNNFLKQFRILLIRFFCVLSTVLTLCLCLILFLEICGSCYFLFTCCLYMSGCRTNTKTTATQHGNTYYKC